MFTLRLCGDILSHFRLFPPPNIRSCRRRSCTQALQKHAGPWSAVPGLGHPHVTGGGIPGQEPPGGLSVQARGPEVSTQCSWLGGYIFVAQGLAAKTDRGRPGDRQAGPWRRYAGGGVSSSPSPPPRPPRLAASLCARHCPPRTSSSHQQ